MAVDRHSSMATLLREAVEQVYQEDLEDLALARKSWGQYSKRPEKAMPARDFFAKRSRKRG